MNHFSIYPHSIPLSDRVLYNPAVLDIEPPNLYQLSIISPIISVELSDHSHGLGCINSKLGSNSKVCLVSLPPMVVVTTVLVTNSIEPVSSIIVTTLNTLTSVLT